MELAIDSSGLRAAHDSGCLLRVQGSGSRLHVSPLTWRPTPDAEDGYALAPVLRFPGPRVARLDARDRIALDGAEMHPMIGLCEHLEELHADGCLVLVEDRPCSPIRVIEVEEMWFPAGLVGRPTDETISAVLTAERARVPLVCADHGARRLAEHCGVDALSVADLGGLLAA